MWSAPSAHTVRHQACHCQRRCAVPAITVCEVPPVRNRRMGLLAARVHQGTHVGMEALRLRPSRARSRWRWATLAQRAPCARARLRPPLDARRARTNHQMCLASACRVPQASTAPATPQCQPRARSASTVPLARTGLACVQTAPMARTRHWRTYASARRARQVNTALMVWCRVCALQVMCA